MSEIGYRAKPLTTDFIRDLALTLRDGLGYREKAHIDVVSLLEFNLPMAMKSFIYDIQSVSRMGANHGLASPDHEFIAIREDVYENAIKGHGRDRFTIVHEVGHVALHTSDNLILQRTFRPPSNFSNPEWQADTFAAEFLMDHRMIRPEDDEVAIAKRFGVPICAGRRRLRFLKQTGILEIKRGPGVKPRPRSGT